MLAAGVLTGPRNVFASLVAFFSGRLHVTEGYVVDAPAALDALEAAHPEAAAWWKEHRPDLWRPGRRFVFRTETGHVAKQSGYGS